MPRVRLAVRLAWVLLGLLTFAGAVHAPLHADGSACSPASLCAGMVPLDAAMAAAMDVPALLPQPAHLPPLRSAPRDVRPRLTQRGRAPPAIDPFPV